MASAEHVLLGEALDRLQRQGLPCSWSASEEHNDEATLRVTWDGGQAVFGVLVRPALSAGAVALLPPGEGRVIVTGRVSAAVGEALEERGWYFLDSAGNGHLEAPGLLFRVVGQRAGSSGKVSAAAPFTASGIPVTFALLVRGGLKDIGSQRDLADLTQVSLGTANGVVRSLRGDGHLTQDGLLQRGELLRQRWIDAYLIQQQRVAPGEKFSSGRWTAPKEVLGAVKRVYAGSELAAAALGYSIRPVTAMFYCDHGTRTELIVAGRLRRDTSGWIELRRKFWADDLLQGQRTVPDFLIAADLAADGDPRLAALARQVSHAG